MRDNTTSQSAELYDENIEKTIPLYSFIHEHTIDLVKEVQPHPKAWLDTGCGTGLFVERAAETFLETDFVMADPSEGMLKLAKERLAKNPSINVKYFLGGSEDIDFKENHFDVITAIISHHYFDIETRQKVTENCFHMLKKGGVYINIESIRPNTKVGHKIGINRWHRAQLQKGKPESKVSHHLSRYDIQFFPIKIDEHIDLMMKAGFSTVELFWASFMQVGFYGIK